MTCVICHPSIVKGCGFFENRWIWVESNGSTMFLGGTFGNLEFRSGLAYVKFDVVCFAVPVDFGGHMG